VLILVVQVVVVALFLTTLHRVLDKTVEVVEKMVTVVLHLVQLTLVEVVVVVTDRAELGAEVLA
jgi:hypothetical protein